MYASAVPAAGGTAFLRTSTVAPTPIKAPSKERIRCKSTFSSISEVATMNGYVSATPEFSPWIFGTNSTSNVVSISTISTSDKANLPGRRTFLPGVEALALRTFLDVSRFRHSLAFSVTISPHSSTSHVPSFRHSMTLKGTRDLPNVSMSLDFRDELAFSSL